MNITDKNKEVKETKPKTNDKVEVKKDSKAKNIAKVNDKIEETETVELKSKSKVIDNLEEIKTVKPESKLEDITTDKVDDVKVEKKAKQKNKVKFKSIDNLSNAEYRLYKRTGILPLK